MEVAKDMPCTQHDKENASINRLKSSTAKNGKTLFSNEELQTMASKIRDSIENISDTDVWRDHGGLFECVVQLSFTMRASENNAFTKRKMSTPLLNSCRKLVKESTVSADCNVAFRLLRAAIHGIRAVVVAEGETVPKPEAIIKLLYHIISTLDSIAHKKSSVNRLAAYYALWSFETLGLILRMCCSDFVSDMSKTVKSVFPIPRTQQQSGLALSLSREQLLTIGNHVILASSRVLLLPLWHTDESSLRMEEKLLLRCLPFTQNLRPSELVHLSANFICNLGRPWLLGLHGLKTEGSLKESVALSRRAHKILWDCMDGHDEMVEPKTVLAFRKHSIDCLLAIIPRQLQEVNEAEKELFCSQFASACSQASKAILSCVQPKETDSGIRVLKKFLINTGDDLDCIARSLNGSEIGSYIEFCAYRALYGGSMDTQSNNISKTCIFHYLPYRFQYSSCSKTETQIDCAALAIVFVALEIGKMLENGPTMYQDAATIDAWLAAVQNFELLVSKGVEMSKVGHQVWFKILYKTSLNRVVFRAVENYMPNNEESNSILFLAAQLLHGCYWVLAKAICSTIEDSKKSSVWDFGSDCLMRSISVYEKLNSLPYRGEEMRSLLNQIVLELCKTTSDVPPKCLERIAKLLALNGKNQLDQGMNKGAILSMLHSLRLFMVISRNGAFKTDFQISLRWSAIGSVYSAMGNWEDATVAFVMSLLQDALESSPNPAGLTTDCWCTFFKFLGGLSNGIFDPDNVEDRFQSPRRIKLVSKTVQCIKEWENEKGGVANSWTSVASHMEVVDILLQNQRNASERSEISFDIRPRLQDILIVLFRMDVFCGSNQASRSAHELEYVSILALLHNQLQREICRDLNKKFLCNAKEVSFHLLEDTIKNLVRSTSEAFYGELAWIMVQTNEACETHQKIGCALSRLVSSLDELGRCPKGDWDLLILSFRLSLRIRILMEENLSEPDNFDEFIADASVFSSRIGVCMNAEGSFARACAAGAMSQFIDYLSSNGYELAAAYCSFWCKDRIGATSNILLLLSNSVAYMQLGTDRLPLIDYCDLTHLDSSLPETDDLMFKACSLLAKIPKTRSSIDIMSAKQQLDELLADSDLLLIQENESKSVDSIASRWIRSTILLGLAELEENCGNYEVALQFIKSCFSECNNVASRILCHLSADRKEALRLKALRSQCTVRQIYCLEHLCILYHHTGDYRRALGYADVVWKDFSGLNTISVPPKASFCDILSFLSSQVCERPLQKRLRRNLLTAKLLSSPLDVVVNGLRSFLNKENLVEKLVQGDPKHIVDNQIEDIMDILLIWRTFGSELSSVSCEEIQKVERVSKDGIDSLQGSNLVASLLQLTSAESEIRNKSFRHPFLELDTQLQTLEYRLHRRQVAEFGKEEIGLLKRTVADPVLSRNLRGRAMYILGRLSLIIALRKGLEGSFDLSGLAGDDDGACRGLANARHYFVSALQYSMAFSEHRIRDIYRYIVLSSMDSEVSNKSICRFLNSSIGRCSGGESEASLQQNGVSMTDEVSTVISELYIEDFDDQELSTAKVVSDQAFDQLEQVLPSCCKIISMALAPTGELLVSSIGTLGGCLTYESSKVPSEPEPEYSFYDEFLKPLDEIINKSHEQLDTSGETSGEDRTSKKMWWQVRQKLDSDLMELLARFERICCSSSCMLSILGGCMNKKSSDTPRKKLISQFEEVNYESPPSNISNDNGSPSNLKVPELRDELMSYGFETKRIRKLRKAELVELVKEQRQTIAEDTGFTEERLQDKEEKETVFLILDENLQRFPFESLSCFRGKTVCRMPSLAFMIASLSQRSLCDSFVDPSNISYIIDPESNLGATRDRLYPIISNLNQSCGNGQWKGVVGCIPENDFMQKGFLQQNGLLLYIGHGGGESLLSRSEIATLSSEQSNSARSSVILMGCSSGRLESVNRRNCKTTAQLPIHYEPEGTALSYLLTGAPCVVGNLWDVTDGDIDRYTESLLSGMFDQSGRSIAQCVADARGACKMKYLVGCAPVCYGLPVFVQKDSS